MSRKAVIRFAGTFILLLSGLVPRHNAPQAWTHDGFLRFAWKDVTPGAVSAPVRAVWYGEGWNLALMTEDRHLRLFDPNGTVTRTVRTGIRSAVSTVQEASGAIVTIDQRGVLRRINLRTGRLTIVGSVSFTPVSLWLDPSGNFVVTGRSHEIAHLSAAGHLLWQRSLPTKVVTVFRTRDSLFASVDDGRLFQFDGDGRGRVVFRTDTPLVRLDAFVRRQEMVLAGIEQSGRVSILIPDPDGGRRISSAVFPAGTGFLGVDAGGNVWLLRTDDRRLTILSGDMSKRAEFAVPKTMERHIVIDRERRRALVVDEDKRILMISADGLVEGAMQLDRTPSRVDFISRTDELVLRYEDWHMEVLRLSDPAARGSFFADPGDGPGVITRGRPVVPSRQEPTALAVFADTVLESSSQRDRERLVETLRRRIVASDLYGEVGAFRSILNRLMTEVYTSPGRTGAAGRNDFPDIRLQGASLLGMYLDVPGRDMLADVVARDPDIRVATEALKELSRYGGDGSAALERGMERFGRLGDRDRAVFAEGLVVFLEAAVGDISAGVTGGGPPVHRSREHMRLIRAATVLAAADIPGDLRERASRAARAFARVR